MEPAARWLPVVVGVVAALGAGALVSCGGDDDEQAVPRAGDRVAGKQVFLDAGCGKCHTLAAAGTSGTVGPNLDEHLMEDEHAEGIGHIVEQVSEGGDGMPAFEGKLTDKQIRDVAAFVFEATGE